MSKVPAFAKWVKRHTGVQVIDNTLLQLVLDPSSGATLPLDEWDRVLPRLRQLGLLERVACGLVEHHGRLPELVIPHLQAAQVLADVRQQRLLWEAHCLHRVLASQSIPMILLKGAAYLQAELPMARGRLSSDVDILVPQESLEAAEQALLTQDWVALKQDAYDQQYYRRWMHELPPLRHRLRGTVVDIHHTILPLTSRLQPDPKALWAAAQTTAGGLQVLCPADMLLHSVAHGFHDGELSHALRDLLDIHDLASYFQATYGETFWGNLQERARRLNLQAPLYYALRHAQRFLDTEVPTGLLDRLSQSGPSALSRTLMDSLFPYLLPKVVAKPAGTALAQRYFYLRSHWLRMPPLLLCWHLGIKLLRRGGIRVNP